MSQTKISETTTFLSRRELLRNAAITAPVAWLGTTCRADGAGDSNGRHLVRGIDPKNLVDEYAGRELDAVSDADLYRQAKDIIAPPPRRGQNSFSLHAPLEIMARYGLLRHVDPRQRSLARLQMVATAASYGAGGTPAAPPQSIDPFPSRSHAQREIATAFRGRDSSALEAMVIQVAAQFGTASLVEVLTPLALPTLTGASHSHIGLWLLLRHGTTASAGDASLLRTAARSLARNPELQLSSFSGMSVAGGEPLNRSPADIEREILDKLTEPPKVMPPGRSIQAQLTSFEQAGHANSLFGDLIRHDLSNDQIHAAFRAVLRVSAHSMLQDTLDAAKFGWSHCLTLPQAACGLAGFNINRKLALASTFVWVTSRRCISGTVPLDFAWTPEKPAEPVSVTEALHTSPQVAAARVWHADRSEWPGITQALATEASIRNDQHLVKYVRACFDMGSFDPSHRRLYLAAAAHLCGLWIGERPEDRIRNNLLVRRKMR